MLNGKTETYYLQCFDSRARSPGFDTRYGHILSFLFPSADLRRAIVSSWRKYVHLVLVGTYFQPYRGSIVHSLSL